MITENWRLGGELSVARVGYGTMKLTGWPKGTAPSRETALAVLRRAVELGVNHIDTSYYYARDGIRATELIREALAPYPDDLVIVTKVSNLTDGDDLHTPAAERTGLTPDGLRQAIENNLRTLGVDRLDAVNLRVDTSDEPIAAPLKTLTAMREEGLIRHLGVSNVSPEQLAEAREITPIACVQNQYNVALRDDDPLVDECARAGIAFVPFYPVGGFRPLQAERLAGVAARHGATVPQVALAWLLARSPAMLLIPGTGSITHLEENVAAGGLRLSEEDLATLG